MDERRNGMQVVNDKLDTIISTQSRHGIALFAKDTDNEFGTVGVMTVLQKVDQHIDVLCTWARALKRIVKFVFWSVGGIGTLAGAVAAAQAVGWL